MTKKNHVNSNHVNSNHVNYNPVREQFEMTIQAAEKQDKTITCCIVTNKTNRGRRKVDIQGCQFDDYMKSPVVLAFHDDERIIARCLWIKIQGDQLIAKFQFRDSPLADDIFSLYKEGFLTSWSVGFLPQSWNYEEENGMEIIHISKWVLLEVSAVSIPMDSNAVTLAIGQGIVHDEYLIQAVNRYYEPSQMDQIMKLTDKTQLLIQQLTDDIKHNMTLYFENLHDVKVIFEELKTRFDALDELIKMLEDIKPAGQKQDDEQMNIVDIQKFQGEITDMISEYINKIKGKL